jgi:hypothetical protein
MEGLSIIEGRELQHIKDRLNTIEKNQLEVIKLIQSIIPGTNNTAAVPGFISPIRASKYYGKSLRTIYNKLKAFKLEYGIDIDRAWICGEHCINGQELLKAMQLKTPAPVIKKKNTGNSKS